jgi:UDPglucose--hexose-1-phosphate uridylyltransferase
VHTPRHERTLAELRREELHSIARAWRERAAVARAEGFAHVQALVNEGRDAGASLPHSHSQLVWLRKSPPAVLAENAESESDCAVCTLVAQELREGTRLVLDRNGLALLASYAGRLPYELLLATAEHPGGSAFESEALPAAVELLGDAIRRLHAIEGPVPLNAWLHDGAHWHIELVPRMSVLAGLELGAGLYVNTLAPETAAERLRQRDY